MTKFLDLLDLVPGWVWVLVVGVLLALCIRLDVLRLQADVDASKARADLLAVQLASREKILGEIAKARAKEAPLIQIVKEANDAVYRAREDLGSVVVAADERLRQLSRPVRICRPDPGASAVATGGAGQGGPGGAGLREVVGVDLLVIDGAARLESAKHAAAANIVAEALRQCVAGWQAAHGATKPDAVPVPP